MSASQWGSLGCTPETIVIGGITLYRCGSNWYERVYDSGNVTYIVVNPPPGY